MNEIDVRDVPDDVSKRHLAWMIYWKRAVTTHYVIGILGVTASCIAATGFEYFSQAAAIVSAFCIGVLGFVQPERKYLKFVRAWRRLDSSVMLFRFGKIEIDDLLQAVEDGESIITEVEKETKIADHNFSAASIAKSNAEKA